MWNATNLYFVLCCFVLCLVISFYFFASPFLPFLIYLFVCFLPFFVALSFLLHDLWCLKSHKHSFNLTCLHFWINTCFIDSWKRIHTFSWWFLLFFVEWTLPCCTWFTLMLTLPPPPPPTTFLALHTPPTSCVSEHFPLPTRLVVAPPSLPCSPPPSCLDPSLLPQASPLHRDTPRSHDDGGNHNRGRFRFIC